MSKTSGRLVLSNLVKEFGNGKEKVTAVEELSLTIEPGEFVTLLGPSGCGKTTTLRMIAGFETPTKGRIELDGVDLSALTPDKRPMGMVFQSYALFPHMSVYENVSYGLKVEKVNREEIQRRVSEVLASMSLSQLANRAPNQLSGGQQQRVALARAMVVRPKVLLFDEPLSNLDAKLRAVMRSEIRTIQQQLGITSVFVTHDQDEAMSLSDRIVVMRNAIVEQVGTAQEIYRHPSSIFVADFIGRSNFFEINTLQPSHNGMAHISLFGDQMEVAAHPQALLAGRGTLLVRPESISVLRTTSEQVGIGHARVKNVIFYGAHVEYLLESQHGDITALVSDPIYNEIVNVGELASINFQQSRAWLLPTFTS